LADGIETGKLITMALTEIMTPVLTARQLDEKERTGQLIVPIEAMLDARSVYESLAANETRTPAESTLISILFQIKESLLSHTVRRLWWIDTRDMVSDGLNKGVIGRQALLKLGTTGIWITVHETMMHYEKTHVKIPGNLDLTE
jgi:hypothetical protein